VSIRERVLQGQVLEDRDKNIDFAERCQDCHNEDDEDLGGVGKKDCQLRFCWPRASFLIASTIRSNW
jgi:hypothetical protein